VSFALLFLLYWSIVWAFTRFGVEKKCSGVENFVFALLVLMLPLLFLLAFQGCLAVVKERSNRQRWVFKGFDGLVSGV
jgi:uncharacterized membrane protein